MNLTQQEKQILLEQMALYAQICEEETKFNLEDIEKELCTNTISN